MSEPSAIARFQSYVDTCRGYVTYPLNLGPQVLLGHNPELLISITGFEWRNEWDDLKVHAVHQDAHFSQLVEKLKKGKRVKVWTFNMHNSTFPIYQYPTLGPLCDMDILVPVPGGVVIKRQPHANDQLGLYHGPGYYGINIDL